MRVGLILLCCLIAGLHSRATVHTITVDNAGFSPSALTVMLGDTVVWNCTAGCHNVNGSTVDFPLNPVGFSSGAVACSPWQYSFTFNTAGQYNYWCNSHSPGESGSVTVNAQAPMLQFSQVLSSMPEDGDSIQLLVTITNPSPGPTSVDVVINTSTAVVGNDFTYSPSTLTFPGGSSAAQLFTVYLNDDLISEGNETVTFQLINPTNGATLGANGMHTLTITDNDFQVLTIYPPSQNQFENIGVLNVPVGLNTAGAQTTSVTIQLVPTTSTPGADFIFNDTTISWVPGEQGFKNVPIQIIDDNLYELTETVIVKLTNPTPVVAMADTVFTLFLQDNDPLTGANCSDLFFSEYVEGNGNNKALEIYNPTTNAINLADYKLLRSTDGGASFASFNLTGNLNAGDVYVLANPPANGAIQAAADTLTAFVDMDGNDAFALLHLIDTIDVIGEWGVNPGTGWAVNGGTTLNSTLVRRQYVYKGSKDWAATANTWIAHPVDVSDSLGFHTRAACGTVPPELTATVRFLETQVSVVEDSVQLDIVVETVNPGNTNAEFFVARTNLGTATVGADYNFSNTPFTHGTGTTLDTLHIAVLDDYLLENDETAILHFLPVSSNVQPGADSTYTLTIVDIDQLEAGFVGAGFSYVEDADTAYIRLALSTPAAAPVKVRVVRAAGSATLNADYRFTDTTVTFTPLIADTVFIPVIIIDDAIDEANEQINFDVVSDSIVPVISISAYTITIIDNDGFTGIGNTALGTVARMFPNPAVNELCIESAEALTQVQVTDMLGNTVVSPTQFMPGRNVIYVNRLPAGMYVLTLQQGGHMYSARFVKAD